MQPPEGKNAPPPQSPLLHSAEILLQLRDEFQRHQYPPSHPPLQPHQDVDPRYQHRPRPSEPWTQRSPGRAAQRPMSEDLYRGDPPAVHRLARSEGWGGPRDSDMGQGEGGTRRATAAAALLTLEGLRLQRGEVANGHSPHSPPLHATRPPAPLPMPLAPSPWPAPPQAHAPTAMYNQFYPSPPSRPTPALQHPMAMCLQAPDPTSMSWPVHDGASASAFLSRRPPPNTTSLGPMPMVTDPLPTHTPSTWASSMPPEQQFTWLALSEHQPRPTLRIPPQPPPPVAPSMLMQAPIATRPTKALDQALHHSAGQGAISLRRFLHDPTVPDPLPTQPPLYPLAHSGVPSPPHAQPPPWFPTPLDPSLGIPTSSSTSTLVSPHSVPFLYPSSSAMSDAPVMGLRMSDAPVLPHGLHPMSREPSPRHAVPLLPPQMLKMHPVPLHGPHPSDPTAMVAPHLLSPGRQLSPQELFLLMHEQQQSLNPLGRSRSAPLLDRPPADVETLLRLHQQQQQQQHPHEGPALLRGGSYGGGGGGALPSHYRRPMSASRRAKIDRYLEKRARRVWSKSTVRYKVRKNFADSRKRVRGRFISKKAELALGSSSATDGESGGEESSSSSVTSLTTGGANGTFLPSEARGPIPLPLGPTGTPEQGPPRGPPPRKQSVDTEEDEEEEEYYDDEYDHDSGASKEGARAKSM